MSPRYQLLFGSLFCTLALGASLAQAGVPFSSSRVLTASEKSQELQGFEVLQVRGKDAELLRNIFGHYENLLTVDETVGLKAVMCDSADGCLVVTSAADTFEQDELVENENFDLTPFKGMSETEQAFMSPTLEHADRTEEMSQSSGIVYRLMSTAPGKQVINFRQNLFNGFVESKTLRGEKIEIRCFHEVTTVKIRAKKFKKAATEEIEGYNCQIYSKVTKATQP